MTAEDSGFDFAFWKKIAVLILMLCIVDIFLATYARVRYGDLLFIEGIVTFAAGAYVASGVANLRKESWVTLTASPEGHREFLEEQRSKQVSYGIITMIIGAIMIALSILYFLI